MDWQSVDKAIDALAAQIPFRPDSIIGIVRGGVVPARLLASRLHVRLMYCLTLEPQPDGSKQVTTAIQTDLTGKKVLLVEEMLESGQALLTAKNYLASLGAEVATASLYILNTTKTKPDYYLTTLAEVPNFPWE